MAMKVVIKAAIMDPQNTLISVVKDQAEGQNWIDNLRITYNVTDRQNILHTFDSLAEAEAWKRRYRVQPFEERSDAPEASV